MNINSLLLKENLKFPKDFNLEFKVSARKESIGIRYIVQEVRLPLIYICSV